MMNEKMKEERRGERWKCKEGSRRKRLFDWKTSTSR